MTAFQDGITQYNVIVGAANKALASVAPSATSGVPVISQGASANPAFGTVVPAGGGTGLSSLTAYAIIAAGTTSTGTFQQLAAGSSGQILRSGGASALAGWSTATYPATAGTSGKVLVSDGTNIVSSTPTFPNASATSGKIIKSDGTNWIASTETYAAPSTSGNVMTSDGTNWTSAVAASGPITYVMLNITSAQIKALHGTPIQVVAAPGVGKILVPIMLAYGKFNYGGSNVFVAGASQTIELWYGTSQVAISGSPIISNAVLVGTTSQYKSAQPTAGVAAALANYENLALNLYNPVVTEISGNAAGNNTVSVAFCYYTATMT